MIRDLPARRASSVIAFEATLSAPAEALGQSVDQPDTSERLGGDAAIIMTLLLLALFPNKSSFVAVPVAAIAIGALLVPRLRHDASVWWALAATIVVGNFREIEITDNHHYLIGYWCLAIGCALKSARPRASLATAGRWLIGLMFMIAVLYKVATPDFLDGRFFVHSLLYDSRFEPLARIAGLEPRVRHANELARAELTAPQRTLEAAPIVIPSSIVVAANIMTVWTISIELLIAIAFCGPRQMLHRWRHPALLTFVATTYVLAPVIGFGWGLIAIGAIVCRPDERMWRGAYIAAFVLLQLYRIPLMSAIASHLGGP
jgi:hypothetical protein